MVNKYLECLAVEGNYSKARIGLLLLGIFGFAFFIWLIVLSVELGKIESSCESKESDIPYKSLGCYNSQEDKKDKKKIAIPTIEDNKEVKKFLDGKYDKRENPIEKCAKAANFLGFKVFAIQDGGKCLSSADALKTYKKFGNSTACKDDGEGGPLANMVYEITTGPAPKPTAPPVPEDWKIFIKDKKKTCKNSNVLQKKKQFTLKKCKDLCDDSDDCLYIWFDRKKYCITFDDCNKDDTSKMPNKGTTYERVLSNKGNDMNEEAHEYQQA